MSKIKSRLLLIAVLLLGAIWIMPFQNVHASPVATRLPGVKVGDNATYAYASLAFQTSNATAFQNPNGFLSSVSQITARITGVSGTNVTFAATYYFPNGTSFLFDSVNTDVQTQSSCITFYLVTGSYSFCSLENIQNGGSVSLIAAGLQAPDAIGANPSVILNQTVTRTILGAQRTLNFLNLTSVTQGGFLCPFGTIILACTSTLTMGVAWDQASGIPVQEIISVSATSPVGTATWLQEPVLVGTNIWTGSTPDFSMTSDPSAVTLQKGEEGSSIVTLTSSNGFAATVNLQASTSSPKLSCSLSDTSVTLNPSGTSSSTISCRGSKGTYTVTVMATVADLSHSTTLTYIVLSGQHRHHDNDD
ncbi:MAG TPA: hypothetical protein VGS11_03470 [Candidatus Bathyarchaeia archaeon]|nr:hypothetical protein [Candidatus Bathyarchaeia archaeon]